MRNDVDELVWWEPGLPVWEKRPHVYHYGTRVMWWDEPWRLMHWSVRVSAVALVTLVLLFVGLLVASPFMAPEEPPPPCSDYANWRASEVPARCLAYFQN